MRGMMPSELTPELVTAHTLGDKLQKRHLSIRCLMHGAGEEERRVRGWDSSGTHCRVVLQTILFKTSHQRIRGVVCVCVLSCV